MPALGVAVLSAVATTAGSLTTPSGIVTGISHGYTAAAIIAVGIAVIAFLRMTAVRLQTAGGSMHMHH